MQRANLISNKLIMEYAIFKQGLLFILRILNKKDKQIEAFTKNATTNLLN